MTKKQFSKLKVGDVLRQSDPDMDVIWHIVGVRRNKLGRRVYEVVSDTRKALAITPKLWELFK
jgi:hypothetical protein